MAAPRQNPSKTLPMLHAGPESLRDGWRQASEDVRAVHEVQTTLQHRENFAWESQMNMVEGIYGQAASMRLRTERIVLEQQMRLPGLPSSQLGLETMLGKDGELDFEDFLNDPYENPEFQVKVHDAMESKLRL